MIQNCTAKTVLLSLLASLFTPTTALSKPDCTVDAMLVFDGSGSMAEMGFNGLDQPRIVEARNAIRQSIPSISAVRNLGLIIYGPGTGSVCDNIDVRFGPMANAGQHVVEAIEVLDPSGNTPLTQSVFKAAEILKYREQPGEIVLVTDGKETCGGATCQLAAELSAANNQLVVHVIGFQVRGEYFSWKNQKTHKDYIESETVAKCLAEYTGGHYVTTQDATELADAMYKVLGCAAIGKAGETIPVPPAPKYG